METNKTLTQAQFECLQPLSDHFFKAVRADYCPYPGADAIDKAYEVALEHGWQERHPSDCQHCILRLMKYVGGLYFDTIEAQAQEKPKAANNGNKKTKAGAGSR